MATVTVATWAAAVAAIITDGGEAEDIITVGGTIATEHFSEAHKGRPKIGGLFSAKSSRTAGTPRINQR
jgi:hypothetical protein